MHFELIVTAVKRSRNVVDLRKSHIPTQSDNFIQLQSLFNILYRINYKISALFLQLSGQCASKTVNWPHTLCDRYAMITSLKCKSNFDNTFHNAKNIFPICKIIKCIIDLAESVLVKQCQRQY